MDEIQKYRELLAFFEQADTSPAMPHSDEEPEPSAGDRDLEAERWISLIEGAGSSVMRQARIRACVGGLAAVSRYLAAKELA